MEEIQLMLKSQWEQTQTKLNEVMETLVDLKAENATLKTALGIGCAETVPKKSENFDATSLKHILEEIQSEIRAMKGQIGNHGKEHKHLKKRSSSKTFPEALVQVQSQSISESIPEKFPVLGITNKTTDEERQSLKLKFKDVKQRLSDPADGVSLMGTTLERISTGIPLTPISTTSSVIQLSNYLHSTLTDPQDYIVPGRGKKLSGPASVTGHTSEVIAIEGGERWCSFLCSFGISEHLRLAFTTAVSRVDGSIFMGLGFVPEGTTTDSDLLSTFFKGPSMPDFLAHGYTVKRGPVEGFVSHGRFIARAHMTHGHRAVMHVEIVESDEVALEVEPCLSETRSIRTGDYTVANMGNKPLGDENPYNLDAVACVVEITNALNVSLEESRRFIRSCKHNNFMPYHVVPFTREVFFASHDEIVEAMFAYRIESTDLGLVVAFRAQNAGNSFTGAFVTLPNITNKNTYKSLMDVLPSKSRLYRRNADAKDGEQTIQIRNIRAILKMTEDVQSVLKIRIFAV